MVSLAYLTSTLAALTSVMAETSWFTIGPGEMITIDPNTMTKRAKAVTWPTTSAEPEKTTAATCTSTLYSEPILTHGPTSTEWASTKTATRFVDCSGCDLAILYGGHIFYEVVYTTTVSVDYDTTVLTAACLTSETWN